MAKFWITKSRYLKQRGEDVAHYVQASPHEPALVDMDDDIKPDRGMVPFEAKPEAPEKPLTGFIKNVSATTRKPADKKDKSKRAADQ